MLRSFYLNILFLLPFLFSLSCGEERKEKIEDASSGKSRIKVGLIVGTGGFGDKAFNDMQYNGLLLAKKKFGIDTSYKAPKEIEEISRLIDELVQEKCSLIFYSANSDFFFQSQQFKKYPDIKFVIIDVPVKPPIPANLASVSVKQNEGSFLAGAAAAMASRTGRIGAIGGMDIEVIRDFMVGYEAGARYVNHRIKVINRFIPDTPGGSRWQNPKAGRLVALEMYDKDKADVIFGIAASTNLGIFKAAKEANALAIGVDLDQDYLEQGRILTSMMKRFDHGIVYIIEEIINGRFKNINYRLGIREGGVSLTPMAYTKDLLSSGEHKRLEKIAADIVEGKIRVPTVYR